MRNKTLAFFTATAITCSIIVPSHISHLIHTKNLKPEFIKLPKGRANRFADEC